mmetsp:Transcript_23709/g.49914  ORF Transcript_23709/g.49914 Transcript_23709/m.49914 type:complete len:200 (-) Transcript_23709:1195-1794(-)
MLWDGNQIVGGDGPRCSRRRHSDAGEGKITRQIQSLQRCFVAGQGALSRLHSRSVGTPRPAQKSFVRQRRTDLNRSRNSTVSGIRYVFLDSAPQKVCGLVFLLLVFFRIAVQAFPPLVGLRRRNICVQYMFALGCQGWIDQGRHATEHDVSRRFHPFWCIPISHHCPLGGKVGTGFRRQAGCINTGVNMNKTLQIRNTS